MRSDDKVRMKVEVIRSRRKTLSMQIRDGRVLIRAPLRTPEAEIRQFLEKHRQWLEKHMQKARETEQAKAGLQKLAPEEIRELAEQAKEVIPNRAAFWASRIGVSYGRITIRCQKTRWGSCSAKGNLNFNCLLMLTPPEVLDSVVVHELCHRKEMNHSARFYAEVLRVMPEYRKWNQWLKSHGEMLLARAGDS